MSKATKCPFHVKQGFMDAHGQLIISDVCGVKSACGAACPHAPFPDNAYKECEKFVTQTKGADRQVLVPKSDIEYLPEVNGVGNFSEIDLL